MTKTSARDRACDQVWWRFRGTWKKRVILYLPPKSIWRRIDSPVFFFFCFCLVSTEPILYSVRSMKRKESNWNKQLAFGKVFQGLLLCLDVFNCSKTSSFVSICLQLSQIVFSYLNLSSLSHHVFNCLTFSSVVSSCVFCCPKLSSIVSSWFQLSLVVLSCLKSSSII